MQYILTTVGLSSLTNGLKDSFKPHEIYANANSQKDEIETVFIEKFESAFKDLKDKLLRFSSLELQKLSAELNSLIKYDKFENNNVYKLLCTDTYLGRKSAELLEHYLSNRGINVSIYQPKDLVTNDLDSFHMALADVVKDLSEEIQSYKDGNFEIIFNLTGGFKSVNSFLQTMASLYADKSLYIFESSNKLLTIPRIPIKVDDSVVLANVNLFRSLELELQVDQGKLESIPKTLILKIGDEFTLSAWGEIVWQKAKQRYYRENLLMPVQSKISYSNEFRKDFNRLNPKEKQQLNKSIDKLERYIARGENLKSLRYHPLTGNISQKYSHEFYPFDGGDSRRVYCNEKEGKIIIEKIDAHLK